MKRIIREVVTLIRIERWLVKDDNPDLPIIAASSATVSTDEGAPSSSSPLPSDSTTVIVEETIIEHPQPAADERVVSQRVLEVRQWEVRHDTAHEDKR